MKVIVVTPVVPHPFGDTAARWFYVLITELLARGHEVVALAVTEEPEERVSEAKQWLSKPVPTKQGGQLTLHCHRLKVDSVALRRKWQNLLHPRSEMLQDSVLAGLLQQELAQGYDVLHLEQMSTGWLGLGVPRALLNVHFFDVIDWAEKENMSLGEHKALWQARRATRHLLHGIHDVRLLTPRLKEMAESINPKGHYWVVPLALDTALYNMQPPAAEPVVGLIGSMHWEPSRSAAERLITRIWPLVKQGFPQATLLPLRLGFKACGHDFTGGEKNGREAMRIFTRFVSRDFCRFDMDVGKTVPSFGVDVTDRRIGRAEVNSETVICTIHNHSF